jgi:hypothetical protein
VRFLRAVDVRQDASQHSNRRAILSVIVRPLPPAAALEAGSGRYEAMYKPWSSTTAVPPRPLDRPVWVDLDRLYGEPDDATVGAADDPPPGGYLKATGRVPGLLKRWARAVDGRWFGCRPG